MINMFEIKIRLIICDYTFFGFMLENSKFLIEKSLTLFYLYFERFTARQYSQRFKDSTKVVSRKRITEGNFYLQIHSYYLRFAFYKFNKGQWS